VKNPPLQSPPPPVESSSANAELPAGLAGLEHEAREVDAGAPAPGAAAPAAPDADRPKVSSQDFLARMLKPFEQLAPKLPYVGHGFEKLPWTPADTAMLAAGWAAVLDHYGGVERLGPWGAAMICTGAVFGPRLMIQPPPKQPSDDKPK
jgi:hypothetical protein